MAYYTFLLEVRSANGGWGILRDPRTGDVDESTWIGVEVAPPRTIIDLAHWFLGLHSGLPLAKRVAIWHGRTVGQPISWADCLGVVASGSEAVVPL